MAIKWQKVTLVVPFDDEQSDPPSEWNWNEVADLPDQALSLTKCEVYDSANDAVVRP